MPNSFQLLLLALIQGMTELLPISSTAHVIVLEKLMRLDPASPSMTLILVMLHAGTMLSVIVYFRKRWVRSYFRSLREFFEIVQRLAIALALTGIVGYALKRYLEHVVFYGRAKFVVENLFDRLDLISLALFCSGILTFVAGLFEPLSRQRLRGIQYLKISRELSYKQALLIGAVQGLTLPFRGFSRSGATISVGMLSGVKRDQAESFSFALAVIMTPPVVAYEVSRLLKAFRTSSLAGIHISLKHALWSGVMGMVISFLSGLAALRWLSTWLDSGRWVLFGAYCVLASGVIYLLDAQFF